MTFPLWPPIVSAYAGEVDLLLVLLLILVTLLSAPVFVLLLVFAVRYRRGAKVDRSQRSDRNVGLELSWSVIPFALLMIFFVRAAQLYFEYGNRPDNALEISVVARQWMWKFQHRGGQREINQLHVPAGPPVRLAMISQDVIHSLYLPALRIKHDVLPGRYAQLWFTADQPGTYHLLCAEFCGTSHSEMNGQIVVMEPAAYQSWLERTPSDLSLAQAGARLFRGFGCSGCHEDSDVVRAPSLEGLFDSPVLLASGEVIVADEGYIRDSILLPRKHVVAGYRPVMPTFEGRISEDQLVQLIAYIGSLATEEEYRP